MTQLSLTPIAVFISITTAESWYRQDWETSRRKVNTTHFLVSTLFTLFANKLWVCENGECVWMRRTLIPWLTWQSNNAECFRPRRSRRVEAWRHHLERGESAAAGAVQQPRLAQVSVIFSRPSSQFNKFKQTALLSDSPAVPSASVVRCDDAAALAVIAVQHKMLVVKG